MGRYDDKQVVITGGTSGIGRETARILVEDGARVLVTGRNPTTMQEAQAALGDRLTAVQSDAASLEDIAALAERTRSDFGEIDLLFLNAGITRWISFDEVTTSEYDQLFHTNTRGPYFTVQAFAPLIKQGGAIVLTTSVVDVQGFPLTSVYAASKAAVRSLTRSFARELLPNGIRVNAVSPGVIDTDVLEKATSKETSDQVKAQVAQTNPMKRVGRPDEIARAALFLAFEATYTTGSELAVDGGSTQI